MTHVQTAQVVASVAAAVPAAAPAIVGDLRLGAIPSPHGGGTAAIDTGNVHHHSTAPGAVAPVEVFFNTAGERRPLHTRFQIVGGVQTFDLYSFHAPPPSRLAAAIAGIRNLASIYEVVEHRVRRTLIAGDFNCCTIPACPTAFIWRPNSPRRNGSPLSARVATGIGLTCGNADRHHHVSGCVSLVGRYKYAARRAYA